MVAADLHLPGMGGIDFLEQAHHLHGGASRILLVAMDRTHTRIPFAELTTLQRATALGRIDTFVMKGWVTPEEWLYPQVQEALTAWTLAHRPHHVVYRIVGISGRRAVTSCATSSPAAESPPSSSPPTQTAAGSFCGSSTSTRPGFPWPSSPAG